MKKFTFALFYLFLTVVSCRKYDLESEATKLYGEDFETVLKRFRKTPEYLSILDDKMKELLENNENIGYLTMNYYLDQLNIKIGKMVGMDEERPESTTTGNQQSYFRDHFVFRRQEVPQNTEVLTPVQKLDSYPALSSALSVAERNSFIDLGFEYAGHIIHTVIKGMGPDDEASVKSTRLPFGGGHHHEKITTTTEHVHVHEVTSTPVPESTQVAEGTTTPGFRYRHNGQM